jgi:DNA polymerase-3 subunit gamma/tau
MENFIVSARKYRPDTFQTVVGQASITSTLKNAIKNSQLAHAYLFCGPRGVGKTTCARIFAKTINCQNLTSEIEPCNQCESCKAFNGSRSYNIHELDAASNNSVDDIRNLTDQVRIPPQIGHYSIYIIDEVHMLSQAAFNAFLKTLEEPPRHAIFILATTEKHKIIPTILSRCQIFDFNRIKISDISGHLGHVAKSESVSIESEALNVIAQKADGAMRDALSIFDQIVSFSGKSITYKDVISNLNVLDYDYYFRLVDLFLKNDISGSLLLFNDILDHGFDGHHFITGLSSHFRDVMVCKDPVTIQLLEVGGEIREKYKVQATRCESDFLIDALQVANECDLQYKASQNKRLLVELAIIKMAQLTLKKKIADANDDQALLPIFSAIEQPVSQLGTVAAPGSVVSAIPTVPRLEPIDKPSNVKVIRKMGSSFTPSIKDALAGNVPDNKNPEVEQKTIFSQLQEIRSEPFSQEQFEAKWSEYIEQLTDRPNLKSTLSVIPEITDGNKLLLRIGNSVQEEEVRLAKPELMTWLRNELQNDGIELITRFEKVETERVIFSDSEKMQMMMQKNPNLFELKQKFNLDFKD